MAAISDPFFCLCVYPCIIYICVPFIFFFSLSVSRTNFLPLPFLYRIWLKRRTGKEKRIGSNSHTEEWAQRKNEHRASKRLVSLGPRDVGTFLQQAAVSVRHQQTADTSDASTNAFGQKEGTAATFGVAVC